MIPFFVQESVNVTADKHKWNLEMKRELKFVKEEQKRNFESDMKAYEEDIEAWREIHSKSNSLKHARLVLKISTK